MILIIQLEEVLTLVQTYLEKDQLEEFKKAYLYAKNAHKGQKRKSGEDYIHHSLAVVKSLALLKTSLNTLIAGILHDVVEDCDFTLEDIKESFGADVSKLVDGVTKIGDLTNTNKSTLSMMNIKKILFSGVSDVRILIIKLCDRIHNISTLSSMSEDKRERIAKETLEIYCPIALKLSLFDIKRKLEQEAFQWAYPKENKFINNKLEINNYQAKEILEEVKANIFALTKSKKLKVDIQYRVKTNYSIYRKLYVKGRRWEKIMDLIAIRLVVNNVDQCYRLFGLICQKYKPVPGTYKDYISIPKDNGYQALHIALTSKNFVFETQIKTEAMDIQANTGIASIWKYKGKLDSDYKILQAELESKHQWFTDIKNLRSKNEIEFIEDLYSHIASRNIYTITPKSEVIILPKGSTTLDFAYKVHSSLGNHFKEAVVNGQKVLYDHKLRNGSSVEVETSNIIQVRKSWLSIVKTKTAQHAIQKAISEVEKKDKIQFEESGKKILSNFLTEPTILALNFKEIGFYFDLVMNNVKDLYEAIGRDMIPYNKFSLLEKIKKHNSKKQDERALDILMDESSKLSLVMAHCCNPIPGDHIIGIKKKNVAKIHIQECLHIKNHTQDRKVNVSWANNVRKRKKYIARLSIIFSSKEMGINKIISKVSALKIQIINLKTNEYSKTKDVHIEITIKVKNSIELEQLTKILQGLDFVKSINRLTT